MKLFKTQTIVLALFCSIAFGNMDRIDALGGNPGFWPEDDANVFMFPTMVNNLDMIQVSGAGSETGKAMVIWGEDTTWGFGFDGTDDGNDWLNLMWGNGTYGALFNLGMDSETDDAMETEISSFGLEMGFGMNTSHGEWGLSFASSSSDDGTDADQPSAFGVGLNFRSTDCNVWLFNNMLTHVHMFNVTQGDALLSDMQLDVNYFTSMPATEGVNAIFSMGFGYWNQTFNAGLGGDDLVTTTITLPEVNLGVEADVTDWAQVRFGLNHSYVLSGSVGDDYSWSGSVDENGASNFGWNFGLGFDYGTFTLDMVLENTDLFNDPVRYITGRNDEALSSSATLTWSF